MITAAECARRLNLTGQRFRTYLHKRLFFPDALSDIGNGRVALFKPARLPEIKALIDAERGQSAEAQSGIETVTVC
jgi:hypothetical protein